MSAALDYTIEDRQEAGTALAVIPATGTALAVIPPASLPTILAIEGAPDILSALKAEYDAFKLDVSTEKGRKAGRSMKAKIATAKMDLVRLANKTTENWRAMTSAVVAERKFLEESLDALGGQILDQITAVENIEKVRVLAHEEALREIGGWAGIPDEWSADAIDQHISSLLDSPLLDRDFQEFEQRKTDAVARSAGQLKVRLETARQREAEAAELEHLREEQAERNRLAAIREQAEREAQIAAQAAEQARLAAEAKAAQEAAEAARKAEEQRVAAERAAQAERERLAREAQEAANAARREQDRVEAEARAAEERAAKAETDRLAAIETARLAAEKAERDRKAVAEKAEADRIAAEELAEKRRLEAIEAERKRVADEKEAERIAAERREANVAHRKRINNEALTDIVAALAHTDIDYNDGPDIATQVAKAVISALAKSEIRHCAISY